MQFLAEPFLFLGQIKAFLLTIKMRHQSFLASILIQIYLPDRCAQQASLKYKDQNQPLTLNPNPHFIYVRISAVTNPIEKRNYSGKLRTFFLDLFNLVRRLSFSILSLGLAILFLYKRLKGFHS